LRKLLEVQRGFEFAKVYELLGVEELKYIDVKATFNEAVALFSGLKLNVINDSSSLQLLADSSLGQLFYNFIDNTRKYGKKTTTIRLHFEKTNSCGLKLVYEDDGVSISAEDKAKVFKEGFSTGGSTGFGLFLSKRMVNVYGWQIEEIGEPGKGAKFVMTIPELSPGGKKNYLFGT